MNMFKNNGGFTLVELIVVIAILAILAGVAVPAYSGYINKANEAADYTQLDSIKTAVVFAVTDETDGAGTVTQMVVTEKTTTVEVTVQDADGKVIDTLKTVDIKDYTNAVDFQSSATKATWVADTQDWTLE